MENLVMLVLFLVVGALYVMLLSWLLVGWRKILHGRVRNSAPYYPLLTVIVPFRNEAKRIGPLLESLKAQEYPSERWELLMVNDHSDDNSLERIADALADFPSSTQVLSLQEETGKKAALALGVDKANGQIIMTTDADCVCPSGWLRTMMAPFFGPQTHFVFGPVGYSAANFLQHNMAAELTMLVGVGASTLGWNIPSMCNGANLAFRKESFLAVNGYAGNAHIPSGDDEFLMHKMAAQWPGGVSFVPQAAALVTTAPTESLGEFFYQRIRWASKWEAYSHVGPKVLAISVFFLNFCIVLGGGWLVFQPEFIGVFLCFMGVKALAEGFLLQQFSRSFGIRLRVVSVFVVSVVYPLYTVIFALGARFFPYKWKGRQQS
jgi:poly-beta-1,6-N-acetyl-D-glucosamine synthase